MSEGGPAEDREKQGEREQGVQVKVELVKVEQVNTSGCGGEEQSDDELQNEDPPVPPPAPHPPALAPPAARPARRGQQGQQQPSGRGHHGHGRAGDRRRRRGRGQRRRGRGRSWQRGPPVRRQGAQGRGRGRHPEGNPTRISPSGRQAATLPFDFDLGWAQPQTSRHGHSSRDSSSSSARSSEADAGAEARARSRSRSPRRPRSRSSLDSSPLSGLTPTPGTPRPAPAPERTQPQECFVPDCPWQGTQDQASAHARERHGGMTTPGPALRLAVPLLDSQDLEFMRLVDTLDELFILQLRRRAGAKRKLQASVRLLGPRTRAASFMYLVQMQVSEATRVSFLVSPAHSWLDPPEDAMRTLWSARHFAKPLQQNSSDEHRILELSITIQRVQQDQQQQ